jgi:glycosyltransferase involved in cell wall biosynthesis
MESLAENSSPPISIVVCTRDRPVSLKACLESLSRLDYAAYEVIVVDNAPSDQATAQVVAATPFRYVREDRPGLDWARNRGAAEAMYELIAYTDDDVQVDPDWLRGLALAFSDPQVMVVTGLVLPLELDTPAQHLFEQYGGMGKGPQPRCCRRTDLQTWELIAVHHVGVGANMAFRLCVFETIGSFDTALDVGTPSGGGGDLDMFHRVLTAGLTLRYEPRALVRHQHRRDMANLWRQIYQNGRSFGVYLLKIWQTKTVSRRETALFALRWVGGWLLARLFNRLIGRLHVPLSLVWAEVWGALHAPWAYRATYKNNLKT